MTTRLRDSPSHLALPHSAAGPARERWFPSVAPYTPPLVKVAWSSVTGETPSRHLAMPPPRPRSPLSMSRSSSRLLFHTGRRTSSQFLADGTLPSVSAESTPVALAQRRNASWDNVVDPSSGMGRLARPSANPAAASSGFAMLSGSRSGLSRSSESSSSRLHEHPKSKIGKKRDRRSHPDGLEKKRRVNTVSDITS